MNDKVVHDQNIVETVLPLPPFQGGHQAAVIDSYGRRKVDGDTATRALRLGLNQALGGKISNEAPDGVEIRVTEKRPEKVGNASDEPTIGNINPGERHTYGVFVNGEFRKDISQKQAQEAQKFLAALDVENSTAPFAQEKPAWDHR